ncbi:hypothetical protein HRI_005068700 [Hibiscus trionum]|uniref:DCD domain-containing protein n=1 Tax=Hibiscus trionum TaxID=183268 RepID=A0A9W7JHU5_HIBTR|nr:hypothetical protein HRI_005068700 [Hibiscus trionum]
MALKSQASHAIVPAQGHATYYNDIIIKEKQIDENDQEQLSGFIFMCNGRTKPQCYMYRVFGLPAGQLDVVEKIKPGMKLFLFDFELKLLYGIYEATSVGTLHLEQTAFNGRFPAQVKFKIYMDCLPLHEGSFRHAIEHNYQKGSKFKQELNKQQVGCLLSLFQPLTVPAPGSLQPMLLQTLENQLRLPFPKDSFSLQQGIDHPAHPNVTGLQLSYVQPISEPPNFQHSVPFPQQHYFGSTINMGPSHPTTMVKHVSLPQNYQQCVADIQQRYAARNPTQILPNQYNSHVTMGIDEQLGTRNMHPLPLQREGETVQQLDSVVQYYNSNWSYAASHATHPVLPLQREGEAIEKQDIVIPKYNSNPSHADPHATPPVFSYMPTMGVPETVSRTLPLAYLHPFPSTHH